MPEFITRDTAAIRAHLKSEACVVTVDYEFDYRDRDEADQTSRIIKAGSLDVQKHKGNIIQIMAHVWDNDKAQFRYDRVIGEPFGITAYVVDEVTDQVLDRFRI